MPIGPLLVLGMNLVNALLDQWDLSNKDEVSQEELDQIRALRKQMVTKVLNMD